MREKDPAALNVSFGKLVIHGRQNGVLLALGMILAAGIVVAVYGGWSGPTMLGIGGVKSAADFLRKVKP